MLKGHTFNLQTFTSEAFALFIDRFLNKKNGIAKGCGLSNTNTSVTIADGYFVVRGRFLQVISGVTIANISNNGYYSLVCEIDLTKTNTADTLNQAEIKVLYNASAYPTLTQEDITGDGTKFQYEFARFKVVNGTITDFTDKRTFVDYQSIYDEIISMVEQMNTSLTSQTTALINQIQQNLDQVLDGSIYVLKTDMEVKKTMFEVENDNINFYFTFRKSGNVITVDINMDIPENTSSGAGIFSINNLIPNFAKTDSIGYDDVSYVLCKAVELGSFSFNTSLSGKVMTDFMGKILLAKRNNDYRISYSFLNGDPYVQSAKISFRMTYIVDNNNSTGAVLGDVNGDGNITMEDANLVKEYIMGNYQFNPREFVSADVNEDGKISSADYVRIKNMVEGN